MFSTALAATLLLVATLSSVCFAGPSSSFPRSSPLEHAAALYSHPLADGADQAQEEREFIDRINADRTERGLYALTPDLTLTQAARSHSRDMCARGYFSHLAAATGWRTPMDRYLGALHAGGQVTPGYLLVGENIYYCSLSRPGRDVVMGHEALMNSPRHRANILDPRFARIGVGICRDDSGQFWVTEMFLCDGGK